MRKLKITGIGIALLVLWQLLGLQLVGKRSLMKQVSMHMESMIDDRSGVPNQFYYTVLPFPEEVEEQLQNDSINDGRQVTFLAGRDTSNWKLLDSSYTYLLRPNILFWGKAEVYESEYVYLEESDAFFCDWQSKYIWVLFTWVHLEKEMKSIT